MPPKRVHKNYKNKCEKKPRLNGPDEFNLTNNKAISQTSGNVHWCVRYPGSTPELTEIDSKSWNLKLVSWNVNGVRAMIKNGGMNYFRNEDADIIGIQETKCAQHKIPVETKLSGYKSFWSSADKEGYAGTALYSKVNPITLKFGIGKSKHDKEGRVITAEFHDFYFVTAYVPNSGQGLVRLSYREQEWDPDFLNYLKTLDSQKPLVVCGDLNVAHKEIDLANPETNHKTAGFTDQEREGFTKLLDSVDLVDTYRHFYPDREKAYTFWSYRKAARTSNTGWRLDYFLVSKRFLPKISGQELRCAIQGSDHCPIVLYLKV